MKGINGRFLSYLGAGLLKGEVVSKYGDSFVRQIKQVSEGIIRCVSLLKTT